MGKGNDGPSQNGDTRSAKPAKKRSGATKAAVAASERGRALLDEVDRRRHRARLDLSEATARAWTLRWTLPEIIAGSTPRLLEQETEALCPVCGKRLGGDTWVLAFEPPGDDAPVAFIWCHDCEERHLPALARHVRQLDEEFNGAIVDLHNGKNPRPPTWWPSPFLPLDVQELHEAEETFAGERSCSSGGAPDFSDDAIPF